VRAISVYVAASVLQSGQSTRAMDSAVCGHLIVRVPVTLERMMALDPYGHISGPTAALMDTMQLGAGVIASSVVTASAEETASLTSTIAVSGLASWLVAFFAIPRTRYLTEDPS